MYCLWLQVTSFSSAPRAASSQLSYSKSKRVYNIAACSKLHFVYSIYLYFVYFISLLEYSSQLMLRQDNSAVTMNLPNNNRILAYLSLKLTRKRQQSKFYTTAQAATTLRQPQMA